MKIRTQLLASTLLATLATVVAGLAVWSAMVAERAAHDEQLLAQEAARETANLLVLTQEYAAHFEERAAQQWRQRQSALALALSKASVTPTLSDLRSANAGLPQVFDRLSELPDIPATPLTASRREFLVDQVLTGAQAVADGAYRWSREAAAAQEDAEKRYRRWGLAAFASLVLLLLAQTAFVMRRVLQPIARLEKAAQAIERGQFDTRLAVSRTDEIGKLKRAFNAMTEALSQRTADLHREMALHSASEKRLRDITDTIPALISYIDSDFRLQFANETFREWVGVDPLASVGRRVEDIFGPMLFAQRRDALERALRGERVTFEFESEMLGRKRHLHGVYIPDVLPDGSVTGVYAVSNDVTAMKLVEQRLNELARVDTLTGLPNRRQLEEKLEQAVARSRRSGRAMALLFLDIDRFKQINDEHGHGVGDEVLKEFAQRLRGCVRTTDTVARLAGDEFVIVLEGLHDSDEAELVAQKIGAALHPVFGEAALSQRVTSSIGVAFVDGQEVTPEQIIAKADKALYQAKRAGRATFALVEWSAEDLAPLTRH